MSLTCGETDRGDISANRSCDRSIVTIGIHPGVIGYSASIAIPAKTRVIHGGGVVVLVVDVLVVDVLVVLVVLVVVGASLVIRNSCIVLELSCG